MQHALRSNDPIYSTVQLRRRHSTCLEHVKRKYTKTHFAEGILSYVRLDNVVAGNSWLVINDHLPAQTFQRPHERIILCFHNIIQRYYIE